MGASVIFNKNAIAIHSVLDTHCVSIGVSDIFAQYGTPYGLFVPSATSGFRFIQWIRDGFPKMDVDCDIAVDIAHITNTGEVWAFAIDTSMNMIAGIPYHNEYCAVMNIKRELTEAFAYLMRKRNLGLSQSIALMEEQSTTGMYKPTIITVDDWVAYAKEREYTKTFTKTRFKA